MIHKATPNPKVIEKIEAQGWTVGYYSYSKELDEFVWEIHTTSPAGENFVMTLFAKNSSVSSLKQALDDYCFCPNEHAKMWIEVMDTYKSVPQCVLTLAEDAHAIEKMVNELKAQLN